METIKYISIKRIGLLVLSLVLVFSSCRKDEEIAPITVSKTARGQELRNIGAFYLLNEGNMGSNKATLDYFDFSTGNYMRNLFAMRNPSVNKELGDVGNDLQIYGSKLWAVINNSHLIEVMDVSTAKHIAAIPISNARYVAFKGSYAYVSSYAGEVRLDPNARLGYIAKIDTATLSEVQRCSVGYQPEEMAVVGNKLYVACSGGYRVPNYDTRIFVIDLGSFEVEREIDVAINLHRLRADASGYLWVSSRGNYADIPSRLYVVDPKTGQKVKQFDVACSDMYLDGDRLYGYGQVYHKNKPGEVNYFVIDTRRRELLNEQFISDELKAQITTPYNISVNPETKDILISDAGNFTTPGKLYVIKPNGQLLWSETTGNIPNEIVYVPKNRTLPYAYLETLNKKPTERTGPSPYITKVFEYRPAPGQHINHLPLYEKGDTEERMCQKVLEAIGNNRGGLISLGSWGGYVSFGFDHTIRNVEGQRDFRILGNNTFGSEAGIIYVAQDKNKNGKPDEDEWYEIAGSASQEYNKIPWLSEQKARGKDVALYSDYEVTYHRPKTEGKPADNISEYIRWTNNKGGSGYLPKNEYHSQSYYPLWLKGDSYTLRGTRLPQNGYNSKPQEEPKGLHILLGFAYGYADNSSSGDDIDIDWAVDKKGRKVKLSGIDFIRIQTGIHQVNGWIGENSTEVSGAKDLHIE